MKLTADTPTQRQWVATARGLPWNVLELVHGPIPALPTRADVEPFLLVRVEYASLNVGAIWQNVLVPMAMRGRPSVPEMDLSGVVIDVSGSCGFARGDAVAAMIPAGHAIPTGAGALQEYVVIPASAAVHRPKAVSAEQAAGVMLAGLTARQLVKEACLRRGDAVVVNAAGGGIGHLVVQLVRQAVGPTGRIVGVCGPSKRDTVLDLGADEIVDYTAHNDVGARLAELGPFAAAIDTLGVGKLYAGCARFISPGGVYESVGIKPPGFSVPNFFCAVLAMKANEYWPVSLALGGTGRRWGACSMMNPTTADRQAVMDLLESGLRVTVNKVFDMDEAREAYRYLAEGHASGKVLVKVAASSK